jgi:hypothetical protein
MNRTLALAASAVFFASISHATNFTPKLLLLSAPPVVQYSFDGRNLVIPVTVSGTPAAVSFLVFTKGKASSIGNVTNGFLGWHQVNHIDTCLYISPFYHLGKGAGTIHWNGKDENGVPVPADEYTYYLWGYDNVSPRVQMTGHMNFDPWGFRTIITHDAGGNPLAQPVIYQSDCVQNTSPNPANHTNYKWIIGGDPRDITLRETTIDKGWCDVGGLAFLPDDDSAAYYFHDTLKENNYKITQKWKWVPNGTAILQTQWGDNGRFTYTGDWPRGWNYGPGCESDTRGNLFLVNADISGAGAESQLIYLNIYDGTEKKRFDLSPWWVDLNDAAVYGQATGGPTDIYIRDNLMFLGSHTSCVNQMIDPYAGNEADIVKWTNTNGDYTGDKNFSPSAALKWVCNDYNVAPWKFNISADDHLFSAFPSYGMGVNSFGLYAPDGTGMGYLALAGETGLQKYGIEFIAYNSPYDGIYTTNNSGSVLDTSWWFIGQDSVRGVITNMAGVTGYSPKSLRVAQNNPNPFNASTLIRFDLPQSGHTEIDVFNTAGQKVDTILSANLNAGSHQVAWNASRFAAGIYFYTVRIGNLSKTIRMTLLK